MSIQFIIEIIKKNLILSIFVAVAILLTILLFFIEPVFQKNALLRTSFPSGTTLSTINPTNEIVFFFSNQINEKSLDIKIIPEEAIVSHVASEGEPSITIKPRGWWKYNSPYTIAISSPDFKNDVTFSFSVTFPKQEELPPQTGEESGIDYRNFQR